MAMMTKKTGKPKFELKRWIFNGARREWKCGSLKGTIQSKGDLEELNIDENTQRESQPVIFPTQMSNRNEK